MSADLPLDVLQEVAVATARLILNVLTGLGPLVSLS